MPDASESAGAYNRIVEDLRKREKERKAQKRRKLKRYPALEQRELRQRKELRVLRQLLKDAKFELAYTAVLADPIMRRIGRVDIVTASKIAEFLAEMLPEGVSAESILGSMEAAAQEAAVYEEDADRRRREPLRGARYN